MSNGRWTVAVGYKEFTALFERWLIQIYLMTYQKKYTGVIILDLLISADNMWGCYDAAGHQALSRMPLRLAYPQKENCLIVKPYSLQHILIIFTNRVEVSWCVYCSIRLHCMGLRWRPVQYLLISFIFLLRFFFRFIFGKSWWNWVYN